MGLKIVILIALIALIPVVACEQTLESVKPGPVNLDLGDGYKASFTLGDSKEAYDVVVDTPETIEILGVAHYSFHIHPAHSNKVLSTVDLNVFERLQSEPEPSERQVDQSSTEIFGIKKETPMTIDGSVGFVGYDWPLNHPPTNTSEALYAYFHYYPGAKKAADGIETYAEVTGETGDRDIAQESLPVFQALLDSLKVEGPAIK